MNGKARATGVMWPAVVLGAALFVACGEPPSSPNGGGTAEVAYLTVEPESVRLTDDLPGRVTASQTAEVRARTAGIVLQRTFDGGEHVEEGELLFQIDPAPLRVALQRARAELERAEVAARLAAQEGERSRALLERGVVSQAVYDAALAEEQTAAAQVAVARAIVRQAALNASYAAARSPIEGVVGLPQVTQGALVGENGATLLAVVQQIDPVYVDLQVPARLSSALRASGDGHAVEIQTTDPNAPVLEGQLRFSNVTVHPGTGEVTLRAVVPNEARRLLPGEYVRARVHLGVVDDALLVPQQAVSHGAGGGAQLTLLTDDNRADVRTVTLGALVDGRYVVEAGLSPGERVIVEGQGGLRPGLSIHAVAWSATDEEEEAAPVEPAPQPAEDPAPDEAAPEAGAAAEAGAATPIQQD